MCSATFDQIRLYFFLRYKHENVCATRREISHNTKIRQNFFLVFDKKFRLFLLYPTNVKNSEDSRVIVCVRVGELAVLEFAELQTNFLARVPKWMFKDKGKTTPMKALRIPGG